VYGDKGIGKTTLASQLRYELNRRPDMYPDGIYYFDLSKVISYSKNLNIKDLMVD
jgi:GTPase SAR1 family protein